MEKRFKINMLGEGEARGVPGQFSGQKKKKEKKEKKKVFK